MSLNNSKLGVVLRRNQNKPWLNLLDGLNQALLKRLISNLIGLLRMYVSYPLRCRTIPREKGRLVALTPNLLPHLNHTLPQKPKWL